LRSGDVITAIDGKAVRMAELSDVRQRFRTLPAGTVVRLDVDRGADHKTFTVQLRDLVAPEVGPSQNLSKSVR
jgi:C-terminal processing protease CtpA/Prc